MSFVFKGRKYKEEAEWAYGMIADSPGVAASEMADLMAERFGHEKIPMTHLLTSMVKSGVLKHVGRTNRNGRMTYQLAVAHKGQKRKELSEFAPQQELPLTPPGKENPFIVPAPYLTPFVTPVPVPTATKTINGTSAPMIVVQTINGPMFLTGAQAKEIMAGIKAMFE